MALGHDGVIRSARRGVSILPGRCRNSLLIKHVREAGYFGLTSGKKTDEFAESGLTPVRSDLVNAPCIAEFSFVLECRLIQKIEQGQHT